MGLGGGVFGGRRKRCDVCQWWWWWTGAVVGECCWTGRVGDAEVHLDFWSFRRVLLEFLRTMAKSCFSLVAVRRS